MHHVKARGTIIPLITPLLQDESIDYTGLGKLIDHVADGGADGIFQISTSGEFARISHSERYDLARETMRVAKGRIVTYLGVSDTSTKQVLRNLTVMEGLSPDFLVASLPYYYPIRDDREIIEFFTELAENTALPIVLYNIPVTCGGSITLSAMEQLIKLENIVGIKDSSGDMQYFEGLVELKLKRPDFSVLVGDESVIMQAVRLGSDGQVPSLGNTFPKLFAKVQQAADAKNFVELEKWLSIVAEMNLMNLYSGSWMSAIGWRKKGLELMGICKSYLTRPYIPLNQEDMKKIEQFVALYESLF